MHERWGDMAKNDGGPAFPVLSEREYERGDGNSVHALDSDSGGMSLRDYLAAKAMQGLIHDILIEQHWEDVLKAEGIPTEQFPSFLAHLAYGTADAMLVERSK